MEDELLQWNPLGDCEPIVGKTYIADGWKYRDFNKMPAPDWDNLLTTIGEDNYVLLTYAEYNDRALKRGQMLISPVGFDNLQKHIASKLH